MKDVSVKLLLETQKTNENLKEVIKQLKTTGKEVEDTGKKSKSAFGGAAKAAKGFVNGLKRIGNGLKNLGKFTGVVFIITEAIQILKDVFSQNQTVVDTYQTAVTALSLAFNDFFSFINKNVGVVTGYFKELFENPTKKVTELGNAIWEGLVKRFNQAIEAVGLLASAFVKVFQGDFVGALHTAKQGAKELFDVVTGEEGGFEQIKESVSTATEAVSNYVKTTVDGAKEIVDANKSVAFTQAELERLQLQSQINAERQRQIRDDDTKSIEARIEANEKLGQIQAEQIKREEDLAKELLNAALLNEKKLPNDEAAVAVLEARNKLLEIQERIEGQASEQLSNKIALQRELNDLNETAIEGTNRRNIEQMKFNDQMIQGDLARLISMKDTLDKEIEIERQRLQAKVDLYAEGTQARADAEQELADFEQEKRQEGVELDKATTEAKLATASAAFGNLAAIFGENSKVGKAAAIAQTTIDTFSAAQAAYKSQAGIPVVGPVLGGVAAAAAIAAGVANVKKITAIGEPVQAPSVSGERTAQAPAFNIVGASPENQLARIINQQEQQPVKAYVVANDVSSQQALDRNIVNKASLG